MRTDNNFTPAPPGRRQNISIHNKGLIHNEGSNRNKVAVMAPEESSLVAQGVSPENHTPQRDNRPEGAGVNGGGFGEPVFRRNQSKMKPQIPVKTGTTNSARCETCLTKETTNSRVQLFSTLGRSQAIQAIVIQRHLG